MHAVQQTPKYKGAISESVNYNLEASLLGIPLWLHSEGHEEQCAAVLNFIVKKPRELYVRHVHRCLWDVFNELSSLGRLPTEAWIEQTARSLGTWTDDQGDDSRINIALLCQLQERGNCGLAIKIGDPTIMLARDVARELWSLHWWREVIRAVENLHIAAVGPWHPEKEAEIGELVEQVTTSFNRRPSHEKSCSVLRSLVQATVEDLKRQAAGEDTIPALKTGFHSLDHSIGGLLPGNLLIIAGRTSMGKTALGLGMTVNVATQGGVCLYSTFEMTRNELVRRIISAQSQIGVLRMRHGTLEDWQLIKVEKDQEALVDLPIIIDEGNHTPAGIEARIREINGSLHPASVELVIVDHLQLMGIHDQHHYQRRDLQLGAYTAQLKDMAKRLDLTVIALSQLNRNVEGRPLDQRHPRLSDLRESGALEPDADIVIGLYRKHPDTQKHEDLNHAELSVLKNRSGPTGRLPLMWLPDFAEFINADGSVPEAGADEEMVAP